MNTAAQRPARVLFLAWGFSIHAFRRIKVFADDSRFQVALVSNHHYEIAGVNLYPLFHAGEPTVVLECESVNSMGKMHSATLGKKVARNLNQFAIIRFIKDLFLCVVDFWKLYKAYREFCPDVIFLQTLLYPCYLAYMLPRKTPIIVTFWNGDVIWWAKWNGIERLFKKWIVTYGANRAAAVTVNSPEAKNACLRYGVVGERIHLIRYPGVDLQRFSAGPRDIARKRFNISDEGMVFCPRGFAYYVNSDVIIQAAQIVCRVLPKTIFLFISAAGKEDFQKYKELAQQLGVLKNIRWDEQVAWEVMPDYYRAADVMVSISSNDSLPNCMLEAMGCGTTLIMGDIPEISEWIIDGENGYVVPVRDAKLLAERLITVLQNKDDRVSEWSKKNRLIVEEKADSRVTCEDVKRFVRSVCEDKIQ